MRPTHVRLAAFSFLLAVSIPAVPGLDGQVLPLKTVPLATGDQFLLHPSQRLAMGGVSIALDDRLGDPFSNPARGALLEAPTLVISPTYYGISEDNGAGRTLPVTLLAGSATWFGAASVAIQEIEGPDPAPTPWPVLADVAIFPGRSRLLSEASAPNAYFSGMVGRSLGGGWAVAGSALRAELDAVDGVEHLFPRREALEQDGHLTDLRLGVLRVWEDGGRLDGVFVHRRLRMSYEVTRLGFVPADPTDANPPIPVPGEWRRVAESNPDHTNTTGVQLGWVRPLEAPGWRLGGILTVNRKSHPKIPNYEIMDIPRDPGDTWAYALGVGLAREEEETTYGIDLIVQPAWTETWAEATEPVPTATGDTIPVGERTVENDFSFRNLALAVGVGRELGPGEAQVGLQLRSYAYDLDQDDRVEERRRKQEESWLEWTPTWGGSVALGDLRLRYEGRLTTGTGRPGTDLRAVPEGDLAMTGSPGVDFLPAPTGPLTLTDARVWTHRLSVEIPVS